MSDREPGGVVTSTVPDRSRALVFVERRHRPRAAVQAPADFLAQLIACRARLGEFKRARRAEPADAACLYRAGPSPRRPGFEVSV